MASRFYIDQSFEGGWEVCDRRNPRWFGPSSAFREFVQRACDRLNDGGCDAGEWKAASYWRDHYRAPQSVAA